MTVFIMQGPVVLHNMNVEMGGASPSSGNVIQMTIVETTLTKPIVVSIF